MFHFVRNEELNLRMRQDIERLSKLVKQSANGNQAGISPYRKQGEPPQVYDMRVSMVDILNVVQNLLQKFIHLPVVLL